jgi:hypothetical protein
MNNTFRISTKQSNQTLTLAAAVLPLFLFGASSVQAQQGTSLADAARQARAQKQAVPHSDSTAQQLADQLADDQNDNGAPGGFKTYNTGDYKVWVPAPYRVEGHDDAGTVLSGPSVGAKQPLVLLGTPLANRFGNNDDALQDAATQFSHVYAQTASCTKTSVASHTAFQCGLGAANLLGKRVSGNAVFLRSANKIYPILCVTPTDSWSRDIYNNARSTQLAKQWAQENLSKESDDVKNVMHQCETVFQSIHLTEGPSSQSVVAASQAAPPPASSADSGSGSGPSSLADAAHGLHTPHAQEAPTPVPPANVQSQSSIPEGFKAQPFTYCKTRSQCFDASVLVPTDAQLVSSSCKQYIFQVKVQGAPFLLLAGPAGGEGCAAGASPGQVSWSELAAPDNARAPGTFNTISSRQTTIDGKPAVIIQIGLRKSGESWMGKRAEIESNGVPLVVGCLGHRDHFADADAVCSNWIGSLRLP